MYKLLVAATAITLSLGCQAVWRIFLLKSRLSTLISSFFLLPPVDTLRGLSVARGLLLSRDASSVMSRRVASEQTRKRPEIPGPALTKTFILASPELHKPLITHTAALGEKHSRGLEGIF
ncbi:hypothetical protein EYF80_007976 [Liparis tanakae]|uniref:Uncharacterized protein n=1 Tax=Liparis tanakae TaxID=230148 RepID=A0A4Z2IVS2_9TELE|nr:hypothetical protein EYF80_007976 [Liparis tanakae]